MIFPGYVPLIADFPMKLSDCMTLGYCDISTPFLSKNILSNYLWRNHIYDMIRGLCFVLDF